MRRRDGNKKRRVERRDEAVARTAAYSGLSRPARLARIQQRPGACARELLRLTPPVAA